MQIALRPESMGLPMLMMQLNLRLKLFFLLKMMNFNPRNAALYLKVGDILKIMGHTQCNCAIKWYICAVKLCPTQAQGHIKLASLLKARDQFLGAIVSFRAALNLKYNYEYIYCELAHCYQLICYWHDYENRMHTLATIVTKQLDCGLLPNVDPWHSSTIYTFSLALRRKIAVRNAEFCLKRLTNSGLLDKRDDYVFPRILAPVCFRITPKS